MTHRKTAAIALCLVAICVAAVLWPPYQARVRQRKLAEAARLCRASAERGDTGAQYSLGSVYYYGKGVPRDYAEAARWYRKSAEQGAAKGQYALGFCYFHGYGVPRDRAEAGRWYRKAAGQGYRMAQCELANMYYSGEAVPQDYAEALRLYHGAAEQGDAEAQRALGSIYSWGQGAPQNYAEAIRWFRKAAEQGDAVSQAALGHAYRLGLGVPRDNIQAARWYLKVVGHCARYSARRMGWASFVALLAALATLVPERRWRRGRWLPWALLSAASAAYVLHLQSSWTGLGRALAIVLCATLSVISALMAVSAAERGKKRGAGDGQPAAMPEGTAPSPVQ
jgi:TPR repeat protein